MTLFSAQTQSSAQGATSATSAASCTAVVIGARGYSGAELARILFSHPSVKLVGLYATQSFSTRELLPEWTPAMAERLPAGEAMEALEESLAAAMSSGRKPFDYAFLATPAEVSMELAPKLLKCGVRVIDVSGAFRLKGQSVSDSLELYKKWYGFTHTSPELVQSADYGLQPFQKSAPTSNLISNPGCYATATALALIPLYAEGLIELSSVAVDAKSGTTGAGKKAEERLLHAEVDGGCLPYRVGRHQHEPEIAEAVARFALKSQNRVKDVCFSFVPNLLPVRRGIIVSVHARLKSGITAEQVKKAYTAAYGEYALVRLAPLAEKGNDVELTLRRVVGSARATVAWNVRSEPSGSSFGDQLTVFCLIDNLMKGAASQAVENLNRFLGLPLETGLLEREGVL